MTTTTHTTAADAISHSEQFGEIAYCENTPENHETLLAECDDHTDNADYWADDDSSTDGMAWRVMIDAAESDGPNPAMIY